MFTPAALCSCIASAHQQSYSKLAKNVRLFSNTNKTCVKMFGRESSGTEKYNFPLSTVKLNSNHVFNQRNYFGGRFFNTKPGDEIPSHLATVHDIGVDEFDHVHPPRKEQKQKRDPSGTKKLFKLKKKNALITVDALRLTENLYKTYPQLVEFNESQFVEYLQRMSAFAIDVERASEILIINPNLVNISTEKISLTIEALRFIGINEKQRKHLVRRCPVLFTIPPKRITKHFLFLKTYLSAEETIDVIEKSVEVFLESEASLKGKLEYLIKDMSHETKNIVSCKALSHSLKHIKTRHEFLIRAGFFKPIPYNKLIKVLEKEYKDRNKPRDKYFKPHFVVCYKDQDFLKVCTNDTLTLNELSAFEELYEAEMNAAEELKEEELEEEEGQDEEFEDDDDNFQDAVSLVRSTNSQGFLSSTEIKSCYF